MPGVLPPVTDCGCTTTSSNGGSPNGCCPSVGVEDPNTGGVVPPDITVWAEYLQLADLVNGPVLQGWRWNPNLLTWQ